MAIELSIESNFNQVQGEITAVLKQIIEEQNPILIAAATGVLAHVAYRIHTEGRRGDGSKIGLYSAPYLKYRQGPKFNRTASQDVVLSLTRQMENDFSVVANDQATGLGFKNRANFDKATWMEANYPGTYTLSSGENEIVTIVVEDYINGLLE